MSVIVNMQSEAPRIGRPNPAPTELPPKVWTGMYVAAWARAEICDVELQGGRLDLRCRYAPTDELAEAFAALHPFVAACVGWAIPLLRNSRGVAFAASWPHTMFRTGEWGMN